MLALAVTETGASGSTEAFSRLLRVVHERSGLDLTPYKGRFLERRVAIRLRATRAGSLDAYLALLESDGEELERLLRCLTIHVSTFFRNASTFEAIRRQVFPALFASGAPRHLRFWSVGCARGEEPFSLAMLVHEHLGAARRSWDVRIEAIDVDTRVLEEAKRGEFGWHQVADLDAALRARYFVNEGCWRLVPEIRRMVRFHRRDILMDPPHGEFDFILCRNLLIYLDRPGQEEVLERFARCLRPGGYLVLGRTEVFVGAGREAFEAVDARERIYRRLPAAAREPAHAGAQRGRT